MRVARRRRKRKKRFNMQSIEKGRRKQAGWREEEGNKLT